MSVRNAERHAVNDAQVWLDGLEKLLRAQLEGHQKLVACIARKQQAIRTADLKPIQHICSEEAATLKRLNEHEQRRLELIAHLGGLLKLRPETGSSTVTVSQIAKHEHVAEPQRARLLAFATQLREVLADIKGQSSIVRTASEALARHMSGIVQTVQSALGRAGVYGQRGTLQSSSTIATSMLDLKS
jgi:hypothetical protein